MSGKTTELNAAYRHCRAVAKSRAKNFYFAFLALPREKTRRGAGKPMVENNGVQSHVAQSEARWRSARYFLHAAADEA